MYKIKTCPKDGMPCTQKCADKELKAGSRLDIKLEDAEFYKVYLIEDLFAIFRQKPKATYMLHGGNTAHGNRRKIILPFVRDTKHMSLTCADIGRFLL